MRKRKKRGRGDGPGVKTVEDRGGKDRVGKLVRTEGEGLGEGRGGKKKGENLVR